MGERGSPEGTTTEGLRKAFPKIQAPNLRGERLRGPSPHQVYTSSVSLNVQPRFTGSAHFQVGWAHPLERPAGLEACDTADSEVICVRHKVCERLRHPGVVTLLTLLHVELPATLIRHRADTQS